jgi:hypothetical protein
MWLATKSIETEERSMTLFTGLLLLALGVVVWLFGNRMWLLGAGAGALLGIGLVNLLNISGDGLILIIVVGLAIALGVLGFIGKGFAAILAMIIGFIAGGAVTLAFLDLFSASGGFMAWILALIGGVVGALIFARFLDWALIIFASLLGSMLIVRGVMASIFPQIVGVFGTLIVVVLTGLGIFYHYRQMKPKTAAEPPAAPKP